MPYIKSEKRVVLEPHIARLVGAIRNLEANSTDLDGTMNYTITTLINRCYPDLSYKTVNAAMGMLNCVGHEYYRRQAAPYENQKAFENGDVYPVYPNL